MKGFLADFYLRPSCYACSAKCGKSGSDITIGDLWGAPAIIGDEDDDKGISLVLINRERHGLDRSLWIKDIDYQSAFDKNPAIEKSVRMPKKRFEFYSKRGKSESLGYLVNKLTHLNLYIRMIRHLKRMVKRVIAKK